MNQSSINSELIYPLRKRIHQVDYPAWIFDENSLKIVDAN